MMHILSFVHIALPVLILFAAYYREMTVRQKVAILCIPLIAGLANWYWIAPLLQFFNEKTIQPGDYEFNLQIKSLLEPLQVYIVQRKSIDYSLPVLNSTFIDVLVLAFSGSGFYCWYNKRSFHLIISFVSAFLFVFVIAFYGSHTVFFAQLQPERFTLPLTLLLILPASIGIHAAGAALLRRRSTPGAVFILCAAFVLLYRPVVRPFFTFYQIKPFRLSCVFPDSLRLLLKSLETHTTREGRILIEDSEFLRFVSPFHKYYGGHFPGLFPEYLQREYLCGPRPMYPVQHSYASFVRGVLFDKELSDYSRELLEERFAAYNVKWIVCWYEESKNYFARFPDYIHKLADIDDFSIYEVKRQPTFFIKGRGTARADYNRIELENIIAEDNEIILSYHWMQDLKAVPEGTIERVFLEGDPVGFIKIKNPPRSLEVVNGY
jgi:hypothetical protein